MLSSQRAAFSRRCRICQNISFFPFIRHKYMNGVTFPKTNMPKDDIYTKLFSIFLLSRKGNNAYDPYFNSMIWHITLCQYLRNMEIMPKRSPKIPLLGISLRKAIVYRLKTRSDELYLLARHLAEYAFTFRLFFTLFTEILHEQDSRRVFDVLQYLINTM